MHTETLSAYGLIGNHLKERLISVTLTEQSVSGNGVCIALYPWGWRTLNIKLKCFVWLDYSKVCCIVKLVRTLILRGIFYETSLYHLEYMCLCTWKITFYLVEVYPRYQKIFQGYHFFWDTLYTPTLVLNYWSNGLCCLTVYSN